MKPRIYKLIWWHVTIGTRTWTSYGGWTAAVTFLRVMYAVGEVDRLRAGKELTGFGRDWGSAL